MSQENSPIKLAQPKPLLVSYRHKPLSALAVQYARDASNAEEIVEHFFKNDVPCKMAKTTIYFFAPKQTAFIDPGNFVVYVEGDQNPHVLSEEMFHQLYDLAEPDSPV